MTLLRRIVTAPLYPRRWLRHWKQMTASPQIGEADELGLTAFSLDMAFPDLRGIFVGGSGANIGNYAADKFQLSGKATHLFQDETRFYQVKQGTYLKYQVQLDGDIIQGTTKNSLKIEAYSALAASPGVQNRVGNLEYDLAWTDRKDPTQGRSVQITLVNSVSSYA